MKTIYIAYYHDREYPTDDEIIGASMTPEGAQALIDERRAQHGADSYRNSPYYYGIEETQLHD